MAGPVPVNAQIIHDCDQPGPEFCTPIRVKLQQPVTFVFTQFFADTLETVIGLVLVGCVPIGDHHDSGCISIQEFHPHLGSPAGLQPKQKFLDSYSVAGLLFRHTHSHLILAPVRMMRRASLQVRITGAGLFLI